MTKFNFFRIWLLIVSIGITVFGLVLALFPQSRPMDLFINNHIDPAFWGAGAVPPVSLTFQLWVYGILGATIAGWGLLMIFVIRSPFKEGQRWAWRALAVSFGFWYLLDTFLSAFYGVYFNVWFNTVLLILVALPLTLTYSYFSTPTNRDY